MTSDPGYPSATRPIDNASDIGGGRETSSTRATPPLDELMLAMDIVDTLRHDRRLIEHELTSQDRDRQLVERLREIYANQGITVADDVLAQGVGALREDRFAYVTPSAGLGRSLQIAYVTRGSWGKYVFAVLGVGIAAAAVVVFS